MNDTSLKQLAESKTNLGSTMSERDIRERAGKRCCSLYALVFGPGQQTTSHYVLPLQIQQSGSRSSSIFYHSSKDFRLEGVEVNKLEAG